MPGSISSASCIFTYSFPHFFEVFISVSILHMRNPRHQVLVTCQSWSSLPAKQPMSTYIVEQCLVVLTFVLLGLTNYHALFLRPHQFLPMCVPEWLQRLWISVSGHSCPAPCREPCSTGFSGTEATRTVGPCAASISALRLGE